MVDGLTARQTQILKFLIDEYIETAEPVGSEALEKKYGLGISPATIRNEMVVMTKGGYLRQSHTSAGRTPTPRAMKFYIDQLMEEKQMSLTDEVRVKEEVWDAKDNLYDLMEETTHALAERTKCLAVSALDEGRYWHAGHANIFLNPEFANLQASVDLFTFLEEFERLHELFFSRLTGLSPIEVLFGEELGWPEIAPVSLVACRFKVREKEGALGVIGPARLSYPSVIPVIKYFRGLLEEIGKA